MTLLDSHTIQCPYCWEQIELSIDSSFEEQQYVEDCQVCCNPIIITVNAVPGSPPQIEARQEND